MGQHFKVYPCIDINNIHINSNHYTTDYYEDLKRRNKEKEKKEKKNVGTMCALFIFSIIVIVAICL